MVFFQRTLFFAACATAAIVLAACTLSSSASRPAHSNAELVKSIRAVGNKDDSIVRVEPLRAPGVKPLLEKSRRQVAARQYQAAAATLDQALKLSPKAPDILQRRAELAVLLGDYAKAEALARSSFQLGPKLGSLCARNWQTVLEMRRIAKDAAGVQSARAALAKCEESGPVRM